MTRVCVVYMSAKHIHALNVLIISVITSVFIGCVCVWRLILKKNRESIPDRHKYLFATLLNKMILPIISFYVSTDIIVLLYYDQIYNRFYNSHQYLVDA